MRHTKSGSLYKSGGLKKDTTDIYRKEKFLDTLSDKVEEAIKKYDITEIYLFSPGHTTKQVRESWKPAIQKIVRRSIRGNYTKHHPMDLLSKIDAKRKKKKKEKNSLASNAQVSTEARKIHQSYYQRNHMSHS